MKPIGPYVAARDLTGDRPAGAVRTLRATDRLTGMPVLLHVLPHVAPLPELPQDPALLRPSEGGLDGDLAYVVTELPPHALPAADPLLAARGALAGLAALHEAGQTHGGVGAAQLWSVDGRVALAGAGLPWGGEPGAAGDLHALRVTLETLGGLPPALRDAPEGTTARDLLARLEAPGEAMPPHPPAQQERQEERTEPSTAALADAPAPLLSQVIVAVPDPGGAEASPESPEVVDAPLEASGTEGAAAPGPLPASTRQRIGEPVRIAWNADGTRRVVKPGQEGTPLPPRARSRRPAWLWPALGLLALLLLALAAVLWAQRAAPGAAASGPGTLSAAATEPCCPVRFTVRGDQGIPVRLSVIRAPEAANLPAGRELGRAPGTVRFPRPGSYTLRVAAEGFTPGRLTVTAPSTVPVTIDLAP